MAKKKRKPLRKMKARRKLQKQRSPITLQTVSRDVDVVEDGYRIVGPAQAMMDYAKPLLERMDMEGEDDLNKAMSITQLCWNLALTKDKNEQVTMKKEVVKQVDLPDAESFVDSMIERHKKMFPELGKTLSFYIKERVIDEPVDFEPFDESTLDLKDEILPATKTEVKLAQKLEEIDASVLDDDWERIEKSFFNFQEKIVGCYFSWCIEKGVPENIAGDLSFAVDRFLDFVYRYDNGTLKTVKAAALREFMRTFFIRKCWAEPEGMSAMPTALKLFTQYLGEKDILTSTNKITRIVEAEKEIFLENLRDYNNPQSSP